MEGIPNGSLVTFVLALSLLAGCASRPINEPVTHVDPGAGYRASNVLKRTLPQNDPDTLFALAFSGGGTRAAAFSYGVLEELRRTGVARGGTPHPLLDEVDMITGVSGGSFTALSYALYGETLFGTYADAFLKRDVEAILLGRLMDPLVGLKAFGGSYGRSELAEDYYDEILFHGATFADLAQKPTPMALVTGTDLSTGARFGFTQTYFDLICSNLGKMRLARAAAASSAVPVVLSPVTLNNYGGHCGYRYPAWFQALAREDFKGRAVETYLDMQAFQDSTRRPYIHLVDGGVSDNLGLRSIIEALQDIEISRRLRSSVDFHDVHRVFVLVVNARSSPTTNWDESPVAPNILQQMLQASSVPIDRYSYDSVELMKNLVARWATERDLAVADARLAGATQAAAEAAHPAVEMVVMDVSFAAIADADTRHYFENLPTSFVLTPEQVDRLREVAGTIMRASPQYQQLLQSLGAGEHPQAH